MESEHPNPGPFWYIGAALIPIVGIVLAIIAFARNKVGPGLGLVLTSVVAFCVWAAILIGAAAQEAETEYKNYSQCLNQTPVKEWDQCDKEFPLY